MANQSLSHTQKKTKTSEQPEIVDPCPICSKDLYLNDEFTQRIGLLGDLDEIVGWVCPHCKSEFDADNHLVNFMGEHGMGGEA